MNFVLFHKGCKLPPHVSVCLKQIRKTHPDCDVFFITDNNIIVDDNKVKVINTNDLQVPDIGDYYIHDYFSCLWRNSALRLFYIEALMNNLQLTDVIHFDNDVIVYQNIEHLLPAFKLFNVAITSHFDTQYVFGFSYIKDAASLGIINEKLIGLLLQGEHKLSQIITDCMPHEMRLLGYIGDSYNLIEPLPITPASKHFDKFGVCFDPSSYGQYLGGLAPELNHIIGKDIIDGKIKITLSNKQPELIYNGSKYNVINLHIHNKKLHEFV